MSTKSALFAYGRDLPGRGVPAAVRARRDAIMAALEEDPVRIGSMERLQEPAFDAQDVAARIDALGVHSASYLAFLATAHASWAASGRHDCYEDGDGGVVPYHHLPPGATARCAPVPAHMSACLYMSDAHTPLRLGTWESALAGAAAALDAAGALAARVAARAYCLTELPGHHARAGSGGGYCYLNNAALLAREYQRLTRAGDITASVAIVDVDYHHGDGTQQIFWEDPSVLTVSVHADPTYEYPHYCGRREEVGESAGTYFNLNVPLAKRTTWGDYATALRRRVCPLVRAFRPDLIVIAFGTDTCVDDPDAEPEGGFALDPATDYAAMGAVLAPLAARVAVVQEGGYRPEVAGTIVRDFLAAVLAPPPPPPSPSPQGESWDGAEYLS